MYMLLHVYMYMLLHVYMHMLLHVHMHMLLHVHMHMLLHVYMYMYLTSVNIFHASSECSSPICRDSCNLSLDVERKSVRDLRSSSKRITNSITSSICRERQGGGVREQARKERGSQGGGVREQAAKEKGRQGVGLVSKQGRRKGDRKGE